MGRLGHLTLFRRTFAAVAVATLATVASPAFAGETSALAARQALESGRLEEGASTLAAAIAADAGDQEARFGLGMIRFVQALEHLSQGLYHYGLEPPGSMLLPVVRVPVPVNPNPARITYEDFRGLQRGFVDDLAGANEALAAVSGPVLLPVDLAKVRYDADDDGDAGDDERLMAVMAVFTGGGENLDDLPAELMVHFDQSDAVWLRGYTQAISAMMEFWLAYDWKDTFDTTFHLFFPHGDFPFARAIAQNLTPMMREADPIADIINFIHMFRWPVAEPDRMRASLDHFRMMFELSRQNWTLILAETDDDHEWLPSPAQHAIFPGMEVTDDQVFAWRKMLDLADDVLAGRLLVPHWRFDLGINVERVFTEPTTFDIVLWLTGPAALPYLEDGRIMAGEDWNEMMDAFGGSFATYLFWFN